MVKLGYPIPLNHPANWMPLPKDLNRRRGNQHWATFFPTMTVSDQSRVADNLLIDPVHLDGSLLEDPKLFLRVALVRWAGMADKALRNVTLYEYENMSDADRRAELQNRLIRPIIEELYLDATSQELLDMVQFKS